MRVYARINRQGDRETIVVDNVLSARVSGKGGVIHGTAHKGISTDVSFDWSDISYIEIGTKEDDE